MKAAAVALIFAVLAFFAAGQAAVPPADAAAIRDFNRRVSAYQKLLSRAEAQAPALRSTTSQDALSASRHAIVAQIRLERATARPGDIFCPAVASLDRRRIAAIFHGPGGAALRASLRNADPATGLAVKVNESYPATSPLQSMPAALLAALPPLPKGLEYRIVSRALILYDTASNLVVDLIPQAVPVS